MTETERTELVKRLMTSVTLTFTIPGGAQAADQIETDGDRIKELEAEVERLRARLAHAEDDCEDDCVYCEKRRQEIARAALREKQ